MSDDDEEAFEYESDADTNPEAGGPASADERAGMDVDELDEGESDEVGGGGGGGERETEPLVLSSDDDMDAPPSPPPQSKPKGKLTARKQFAQDVSDLVARFGGAGDEAVKSALHPSSISRLPLVMLTESSEQTSSATRATT